MSTKHATIYKIDNTEKVALNVPLSCNLIERYLIIMSTKYVVIIIKVDNGYQNYFWC